MLPKQNIIIWLFFLKIKKVVNMFTYRKIVNGHLINAPIVLTRNPKFSKPWCACFFDALCLCKEDDNPTMIHVSYP